MPQDDDIKVAGTMTDDLIQKFKDEAQGKEFASDYLKSAFLAAAANTLFYMRRQAGLTQAQVAERLNTKQSAVARLEGDFDGSISLHRYVDFALACGMVPHDISFAPLELAISYTIAQPKTPYTQVNYQDWFKANSRPISTSAEITAQVESNSAIMSNTLQTQREAIFSIEMGLGSSSANSISVASLATTLWDDLFAQAYFQPCFIPPLQLLRSSGITSTGANQSHKEVAA